MRGVLVVLSFLAASAAGTCPNATFCSCHAIKDGISVKCIGAEEQVDSVIHGIESSINLELILESSVLPVLPDSVRKASSLRLYDVHIEKILDNPSAGWPRLYDLVIESSTVAEQPWPYLKEATSLKHLKISNLSVATIGPEFKDGLPTGIAYLDIRKTQTRTIRSQSMSHLTKLKYFLMVDVPLRKFPRLSLAPVMPDLHTFILGNTQIENLEAEFFEGMPKLEVLMLNGNKFKTLDSYLLAPVNKHLTHLLAERNPLICDCNIIWLTKDIEREESMKVLATCTDKNTKERKEVTMLDKTEYCS